MVRDDSDVWGNGSEPEMTPGSEVSWATIDWHGVKIALRQLRSAQQMHSAPSQGVKGSQKLDECGKRGCSGERKAERNFTE